MVVSEVFNPGRDINGGVRSSGVRSSKSMQKGTGRVKERKCLHAQMNGNVYIYICIYIYIYIYRERERETKSGLY